jgi:transposase
MGRRLVDDELWAIVEPLLPRRHAHPRGGRPAAPDRAALAGIVFVLRTGAPWQDVPQELGCSGVTCWRRLRAWQRAGVWQRVFDALLTQLHHDGVLEWSRAVVDSAQARAKRGARRRAGTPPTAENQARSTI